MKVNKEYLASLDNLIKFTPWRCNDQDLKELLIITETLLWEYEELKKEHSDLLSRSISHAEMLKNQLVNSMLH